MTRRPGKILIIDDDPTILHLMKIILQRDQHEVFTLTNGKEATAFLEQNEIHAIISGRFSVWHQKFVFIVLYQERNSAGHNESRRRNFLFGHQLSTSIDPIEWPMD